MKKTWIKLLAGSSALLLLALFVLAGMLSHNGDCITPPPAAGERMSAVLQRCYGDTTVLTLEQVAKPVIAPDEVLIRVHAASVNPLDKHYLHGTPYLLRLSNGWNLPEDPRTGVDVAGVIEAVGAEVTSFAVGEEVFGSVNGAFAEYAVKRADRGLVRKPANLSFEQAAALPVAAITALQALRDKAQLQAGQRVLINGASGGVGSFAVQIAKAMGAQVTAVCSTRNVEMVRSLGADEVIDYTKTDFTQGDARFDAVIDMVGNHSLSQMLQVIEPDGSLVLVGSVEMNPWWGPLSRPGRAWLLSFFVSQRLEPMLAGVNNDDLEVLARYAQAGQLLAVIDARYSLAEVPAAIAHVESGRTSGKVVINVIP